MRAAGRRRSIRPGRGISHGLRRWGRFAPRPGAKTLYGYGAWFALTAFWMFGFAIEGGLAHRAAAIGVGLGLVTLGRLDRHGWVLAAGVVGLLGGVAAVLADLGLNLMSAAGIFLALALAALGVALIMSRRRRAAAEAQHGSAP